MTDAELYKSFDAQIWAKEFVRIVSSNPGIATDEACMTTWFANSLMRGYDQRHWESKEYKRMVRRATIWICLAVPGLGQVQHRRPTGQG